MASIESLQALDLRVGVITEAGAVEDTQKLLRLSVDLGEPAPRTIVAGIAQHYSADGLIGSRIIVAAGMDPRTIRGVQSKGMLLAADDNGTPVLLRPEQSVPAGTVVR